MRCCAVARRKTRLQLCGFRELGDSCGGSPAGRKPAGGRNCDAGGFAARRTTAHYEAIYTEVSRGIGQSRQETGVPHAFGVLTCETLEQALDRAGLKMGNKGFEAALAAIEMVAVKKKIATVSVTDCRGRQVDHGQTPQIP